MVLAFFHQVPQAILRSIIAHMKLTDPVELDSLVASNRQEFGSSNPSQNDKNVNLQRRKTIPLTPARVEFLMGLLAPVLKQVWISLTSLKQFNQFEDQLNQFEDQFNQFEDQF